MAAIPTGLIGRTVMVEVTRGDKKAKEPCEVMACMTGGTYGNWQILVATHDGTLLDVSFSKITLVAREETGGPYR